MTYSEKLKDPRWQKKRLEIMNRDDFKCVYCNNNELTLHVHHLRYSKEPWNINNDYLITLCENCHDEEHNSRKSNEDYLLDVLKVKKFSTNDIVVLVGALERIECEYNSEEIMLIISYALVCKFDEISKMFFDYYNGI